MSSTQTGIEPNELAELYDSLMVIKHVLRNQISEEEGDQEKDPSPPYTSLWIQALSHRVSGEGWGDSPSYGEQQYRRNGVSIHDYREEYGNGTRVTRFKAIETVPPTEEEAAWLGISTPSDIQIPVPPESDEKLPLIVWTNEELVEALTLLGQLPNFPEIGNSTEPSVGETLLPLTAIENDQRVQELVVKVDRLENSVGSKKDEICHISDIDGNSVEFTLWSKHDISSNLTEGNWYWLHNSRVKVWESSGSTNRNLSSTNDLIAVELGAEVDREQIESLRQTHNIRLSAEPTKESSVRSTQTSGSGSMSSGQSNNSSGQNSPTGGNTEDDVVTDLMDDLEFN